jgi:hypothetical protein
MKGITNSQIDGNLFISQEEYNATIGNINSTLEIIIGGVDTNELLTEIINQ